MIDTSEIYESGILGKGEKIIEYFDCRILLVGKSAPRSISESILNTPPPGSYVTISGSSVITNKRLLFIKKPIGRSIGVELTFSCSLRDISSVSVIFVGLIKKKPNIHMTFEESTSINWRKMVITDFYGEATDGELIAKKIIELKDKFSGEKVIEAKRVIIEKGVGGEGIKRDTATEILQKRLARGEITLEEFHKKVQRT